MHHATAVGYRGNVYVIGGYVEFGRPLRRAWVLEGARWKTLPRPPSARAAAGAALSGRWIVVAGGVGPVGLARKALAFDVETRRWSVIPGPTPREHLGVTSLAGTVYAIGGRTAGLDTNLVHFESFRAGDRAWRRLRPVPGPRGGTGAAAVPPGHVVSVGGEEPGGTIAEVFAFRVADRRWIRLADLTTPRHGLGVAAVGGRVFVIGGGPEPGLTVSSANEALLVSP